MQIKTLIVGPLATNCYIVFDKESREGVIIDPGGDSSRIQSTIPAKGRSASGGNYQQLAINYILLTHGHADHIAAVSELKKELEAKVVIHQADEYMLGSEKESLGYLFGVAHPQIEADSFKNQQQFSSLIGGLPAVKNFKVISTPGHSPGSVCYYLPRKKILFSGDTLFTNGVGRTDLSGGDYQALVQSLEKIKQLPPQTVVYPGHGREFMLKERFGF